MECPICKEEVWCLNNVEDTKDSSKIKEACYNCRKRLGLKIFPYPLTKKFDLDNEFMTKEQFAFKKIKEKKEEF